MKTIKLINIIIPILVGIMAIFCVCIDQTTESILCLILMELDIMRTKKVNK